MPSPSDQPNEPAPDASEMDASGENLSGENESEKSGSGENVPEPGTDTTGSVPTVSAPTVSAPTVSVSTRPRGRLRAGALIGVLTALLGFAIAVQVRAHSGNDSLAGLRQDDLVGILDSQNARADRLREQIADLQRTLRRLQDSGDRSAAARQQAEQEARDLGVLLGTLPAAGPGVRIRIDDPERKVGAEDLLAVVEELRGAGAEAIQVGPVRVTTTSAFTGSGSQMRLDGTVLGLPLQVLAIGDPKTLDTALNIPGGVAASLRAVGGELTVTQRDTVTINVVRELSTPKYARPSGG